MHTEAAPFGLKLGCCDLHVFFTSSCRARAAACGSPPTLPHSFRHPPVTPPSRPARFGGKGALAGRVAAVSVCMHAQFQWTAVGRFLAAQSALPAATSTPTAGSLRVRRRKGNPHPHPNVSFFSCRCICMCIATAPPLVVPRSRASGCPGRPLSAGEPVRVGSLIGICCVPYFLLSSPRPHAPDIRRPRLHKRLWHMPPTSVARACTSLSELSVAPVDGSTHPVECLRWAQLQPPVRPSFPFCLLRECLPFRICICCSLNFGLAMLWEII